MKLHIFVFITLPCILHCKSFDSGIHIPRKPTTTTLNPTTYTNSSSKPIAPSTETSPALIKITSSTQIDLQTILPATVSRGVILLLAIVVVFVYISNPKQFTTNLIQISDVAIQARENLRATFTREPKLVVPISESLKIENLLDSKYNRFV